MGITQRRIIGGHFPWKIKLWSPRAETTWWSISNEL